MVLRNLSSWRSSWFTYKLNWAAMYLFQHISVYRRTTQHLNDQLLQLNSHHRTIVQYDREKKREEPYIVFNETRIIHHKEGCIIVYGAPKVSNCCSGNLKVS